MENTVRIGVFDDPTYNPYNSDEINFGNILDPYARIAEWRAERPVLEGDYRRKMGLFSAHYPDHKNVHGGG